MFFSITQKDLLKTLDALCNRLCAYGGHKSCDCKYGFAGCDRNDEVSGCPELHCAKLVILSLTKNEWNKILKRISKFHIVEKKYYKK